MALHKTQCPHCFTNYVISDAQLRVSEGMVRCGTCRERFQARIIDEIETPRFDPREAFIEPLSDEVENAASETISEIEEQLKPQHIEFVDPKTELQSEPEPDPEQESLSYEPDAASVSTSPSSVDIEQLSATEMLANIEAKRKRELELAQQQELALNAPTSVSLVPDIEAEQPDQLIDQVDALVEDKLLNDNANLAPRSAPSFEQEPLAKADAEHSAGQEPPLPHTPFDLNTKAVKKGKPWLYVPLLSILIAALSVLLSYQLWIKQLVNFQEESFAHGKFVELTTPLAKELEKHDIALPVRRNLSQMELLAARTEPHPTRPSTTLLRVSIVNRAEISQPLPWLEMSLTDADGRLVSRRNLSPTDYLYNNNSLSQIGAKELKKVTIELLSFPKHATGYELKLLSR